MGAEKHTRREEEKNIPSRIKAERVDTTMPRDPYEVLGVSRNATAEEIQKAYRKLSKKYHPDRNPGDKQAENAYKEVQEAYEILNDPQKRAAYDRYGFAGPPPPGGFGGGFGNAEQVSIDPEMAEELFRRFMGGLGGFGGFGSFANLDELFGGPRRRAGTTSGPRTRVRATPTTEPLETEVSIPFVTAAQGGTIPIRIGGRQIDVKIPAGIEEGKKLRVPPEATGGPEVLLKVHIEPHPYFRREGNDLFLEVPISISEAILGGSVEVPTLTGERLEVKVQPGTSSGKRARIRGKGIQGGDLYLVFKVMVPPGEVDARSRELITEFARRNPYHPRANVPWA